MMRFLKWVFLLPIIIVALVLAVANRQVVQVSLDPTNPFNSDLVINMPLFMVVWLGVILGVILGGAVVWFRQGEWRRRARRAEAALVSATTDNDQLRAEVLKLAPATESPTGLPLLFSKPSH